MKNPEWSEDEVRATVGAYFAMLELELAGTDLNKKAHRELLAKRLDGRSPKAIDYKLMNVSAVLDERGLRYIEGYKPMPHYQKTLKDEVGEYLARHPDVASRLKV